jgi:hypothetical protein
MNEDLCKPYTNEEIGKALFQMGPTKALGPDGFPALFYQTHWDFFKDEICHAVRSFIVGGDVPGGFCDSIIVLICDDLKFGNKFEVLVMYSTAIPGSMLRYT